MKLAKINRAFISVLLLGVVFGCGGEYYPKPYGYYRLEFPEKEYQTYDGSCPFKFDYPVYGKILKDDQECWLNVDYPEFRGRLHLSYKKVENNVREYFEDSRKFAMAHIQKADAIDESTIIKPDKNVYGLMYEIKGNAASSCQFYITDSTDHFLRGALYFNVSPNNDSIAPVLDFLKVDIERMIDSFEWEKQEHDNL